VTKYAIGQFEKQFLFTDFTEELAQKQAKQSQGKQKGQKVQTLDSEAESESEKSDEDFDAEDEEDEVIDWNRAVAESLYNETRENLENMYNNLALREEEYED